MKGTITVCLIILALANASNFRRSLSASQAKVALIELDKSPIGNMIMSQLQIHLAAQGAVEDLMNLVGEFIDNCNENQEKADARHNAEQAVCEREITNSQAKFEHHTEAHEVAVQTVKDTTVMKAEATEEHAVTVDLIADLGRQIDEGTALRAAQAAEYVVTQARHQKAIDALNEAISLVNALFHSPQSFIQLKSKMESATNALKELSDLKEFDYLQPIIESLAQISTGNMQSNAVGQILDLLNKLERQIQGTKDEETNLENSRLAAWAKLLSDLTNQRNNANTRRLNLENNIVNYTDVIDQNEKAAVMHAAEAERFFTLHATFVTDCTEEQRQYDAFTAQNQSDLTVLTSLNDYLTENLATVEDYVVDRANEF